MAVATAAMSLMGTKVVVTLHLRGRKLLKREKVPPAQQGKKREKVQPGRVRTWCLAMDSNAQQLAVACIIRVPGEGEGGKRFACRCP